VNGGHGAKARLCPPYELRYRAQALADIDAILEEHNA
jgi:hypothetical protein